MKDPRILDTMTIAEASSLLEPDRQALLQRWAETFGVALQDLHDGHIRTYQHDRSLEASASQVDREFQASQNCPPANHLCHPIHHNLTTKTPRLRSNFPKNPSKIAKYHAKKILKNRDIK